MILEVEDTGVGIPKDRQTVLFEQCVQEDIESQNSLGFGLFLTKQAVKKLGGKITVVSEVGRGSLFRVKIPLSTRKSSSKVNFLNHFASI